jgi:CHASE3 domain sensor protein
MDGIQSGSRAFVMTGSKSSLAAYQASKSRVEEEETALHNLTADNPRQQRLIPELKRIDAENIQWADAGIALRRANSTAPDADSSFNV